ncbi:hypothetical protein HGB07_08620 [Candidatus Roizmanbacteria bacterium]|nr:hypothetical protein [Candidatus Roizmanbacteria bacterium]
MLSLQAFRKLRNIMFNPVVCEYQVPRTAPSRDPGDFHGVGFRRLLDVVVQHVLKILLASAGDLGLALFQGVGHGIVFTYFLIWSLLQIALPDANLNIFRIIFNALGLDIPSDSINNSGIGIKSISIAVIISITDWLISYMIICYDLNSSLAFYFRKCLA